ncbi:UvrD-helicase domain-containing protein [Exiguobacterium sp. s21]|uniref:UvrD-helicase domain-containing protein n=1 Tax=Exiguobacterium sp. s21 TaxID=2751244 RepID=UPI001BE52327|nr:UvrD-helicase domain-containing protein [Exiguobacterium sp. s21]
MVEKHETLTHFEQKLLPEGNNFSEEQKTVIFSESDRNIVAGPGSGKTTVLMAKIAMLLNEQKEDFKGLCIITHTNVAVEEIKSGLMNMGITEIGYPNFVGTIHEFFNYFFAFKAYNEIFPDIHPSFRDEELYKERFKEVFNKHKPSSYSGSPPTTKVEKIHLLINDNKEVLLREDCPSFYEVALTKTLEEIIKLGELRHNDSLSLSQWYIKKYERKIKKGFEERFSWVFLDEAQDTSTFQYDLLKKLFNDSSITFQKFGDPYQALYTLYDNGPDAWLPHEEITEGVGFDSISQSTRFGESIAKILRTTCIKKYENLTGDVRRSSFKPHMFLYSTENEVINKYIEVVENLKENHEEFNKSNKKIAVVGLTHNDLSRYKNGYKKVKSVKTRSESIIKSYYELLLKSILEIIKDVDESILPNPKISYNVSFLKREIENNDMSIKSKMSSLVVSIVKDRGEINGDLEQLILHVLKEFCENHFMRNTISLDYSKYVRYFSENLVRIYLSYSVTDKEHSIEKKIIENQIYFGTVHSVKGETHKSTLLLESKLSEGPYRDPTFFYDCYLISNYLIGEFEDYNRFEDQLKKNATRKALKTAYVALSRPTHFAGVAIKKSHIEADLGQFIEKAINAGWEIVDVE